MRNVVLLIAVLWGAVAIADDGPLELSSRELLAYCQIHATESSSRPDWMDEGYCLGFLAAVGANYAGKTYCPPEGTRIDAGRAVVVEYFLAHPEHLDGDAYTFVLIAAQNKWPCEQ